MKRRRSFQGTTTTIHASDADIYWGKLNELSLFANDYLTSKIQSSEYNHGISADTFDRSQQWDSILEDEDDHQKSNSSSHDNEQEKQKSISTSQFLSDIVSIASSVGNSKFSTTHNRRMKLLRRIQEAYDRIREVKKVKKKKKSFRIFEFFKFQIINSNF